MVNVVYSYDYGGRKMFISDVIEKIWEPISQEFKKEYEKSIKNDVDELQSVLYDEKMIFYDYPMTNMNLLVTCGCSYSRRKGKFNGCSMCDYQSEGIKTTARMAALREKSPEKYAEIVRMSFENVRGKLSEPNIFEYISSFDVLDSKEYPIEVFEELFLKNKLLKRKPAKYVFESRASSITKEKIDLLKKYVGSKNRITIELGVEVADEWIRNHWLNKDIFDKEIINAVNLLHNEDCKVSANILIGVPGLTEKQSIKLFKDTVLWLENIGVDHYNIMPLNRKKRTIQGFLYQNLRNNERLTELGIAQDEHTGLPWLFTIMEGICSVIALNSEIKEKISIPQIFQSQNSVSNEISYNADINCSCNNNIIKAIEEFNKTRTTHSLTKVKESFKDDHCFKEYMSMMEKQKKSGDIATTIGIIGEEIAKSIWPNDWQKHVKKLNHEIDLYKLSMVK